MVFCVCFVQLEKSYQIHALDIGNNGSAFVEVLVGRSTAPENYEPLLGMTTFMTPGESKQWGHISRVKMFGKGFAWFPARRGYSLVIFAVLVFHSLFLFLFLLLLPLPLVLLLLLLLLLRERKVLQGSC